MCLSQPQLRCRAIAVALVAVFISTISYAVAAELNTAIPVQAAQRMPIKMPAQPLELSLKQLARTSGMSIAFDSQVTQNKNAPAINGVMTVQDALKRLLQGSDLQLTVDGDNAVIKEPPAKDSMNLQLNEVQVRAKRFYEIGPLPGLGLTKEQIPGNVQSITAEDIKEAHSLSITDLMNRKLQSVTVNDYQGNPFQMDVQYRGFTAGPQIGTPQGLSVFLDGIRVNEPFGDVVNWDMIPMNALAGLDVFPGSNPIFGLNTLGGAISMKTKDGFNNTGVSAEVLNGSYGRKQLQVEGGWNNGTVAVFGAGNFFMEDGWREKSPSKVNQAFGKASYRDEKLDVNLSALIVQTDLVGNGLIPSEMYAQDRNSVFTSPDTTKNTLGQMQLSSSYFVDETFNITGQIYRRQSKRHQVGADVYRYNPESYARRTGAGEQYTCLFPSTNAYGLPDYAVISVPNPAGNGDSTEFFLSDFALSESSGAYDFSTAEVNKALPDSIREILQNQYNLFKNYQEAQIINRGNPVPPSTGPVSADTLNDPSYNFGALFTPAYALVSGSNALPSTTGGETYYYSTENGVLTKNYIVVKAPINSDACRASQQNTANSQDSNAALSYTYPDGRTAYLDGFANGTPGVVEGTPTALLTDNQIDQWVNGASLQFNWNLPTHKFMVGASIDSAEAKYQNSQRLGFLDANRNAFLAPDLAHPMFAGADIPLVNNDFEGTSTTKSIYFSETWTPVKNWNFSASGRYNQTSVKNEVAARYGRAGYEIGDFLSYPDLLGTCSDKDSDGDVDAADCAGVNTGYKLPNLTRTVDKAETEKFNYYSFNPSLGATWQATERLNLFANVAQGTRTPSVIELGCAFDKTPVFTGGDPNSPASYTPKSLYENRQCTLPTTLSGDPYLPQIKATTYDIGMRGTLGESMQWNLGAYQTDLKNDIYFVAAGNGQGFFDTVGETRRRGIEAGFSGKVDKLRFSLNYALTDATFESEFLMLSEDNSSSQFISGYGQAIRVKPGSRMPGVALNNMNASLNYEITPQWSAGLSMVAHSESFVRGNENNEHRVGVAQSRTYFDPNNGGQVTVFRQPSNNPGKVPGYMMLNFQTSYKLSAEWTASLIVNNLLDKEYFSAGRLGRNPFSPSILGAIGQDGYNHNSGDWLSTNFIAPGAPRGIWFSLRYEFSPK